MVSADPIITHRLGQTTHEKETSKLPNFLGLALLCVTLLGTPLAIAGSGSDAWYSKSARERVIPPKMTAPGKVGETNTVPPVLITEVLFDPGGLDGTGANTEFIELYTTAGVDVTGWTLVSDSGSVLYSLPSLTAPADLTIVVFLSQTLPHGHDSDPADGSMAFAIGLPLGDHMPNDSGGLILKDGQGQVIDSVYWGTGSAPPGSGGDFVDISFSGGGFREGSSIGRAYSPISSYSGTMADWSIHGGPTALWATPGGLNWIEHGYAQSLTMRAQVGVNQILDSINFNESSNIIEVVDAHASSFVASESLTNTTISALHSFEVKRNNIVSIFEGTLVVSVNRVLTPGSPEYILTIAGTLASSEGFSLVLSYSESLKRDSTTSMTLNTTLDYTWNEGGVDYPVHLTHNEVNLRTGEYTWVTNLLKTCSDYGGAGIKTSTTTETLTKIGDGSYTNTLSLTRDYPMNPPEMTDIGIQAIQGVEDIYYEHNYLLSALGETLESTIPVFNRTRDGHLTASIEPGKTGSIVYHFLGTGSQLILPISGAFHLELPLVTPGGPTLLEANSVGSMFQTNGKIYAIVENEILLNGVSQFKSTWIADPPVIMQSHGCSHCGSCEAEIIHIHVCTICNPPPPRPNLDLPPGPTPAPEPEDNRSVGGFIGAMAGCGAVGGSIGAGYGLWGFTPVTVGAGAVGGAAAGVVLCGGTYLLDLWDSWW